MSSVARQAPLGEFLLQVVGGGTPPRKNESFWNGPLPWASVKDFNDESMFLHDTQESISEAGLSASAANLIPAGTTVICTRMAVGRAAIFSKPVVINQDLKALYPTAELEDEYLCRLLWQNRPKLENAAIGSTVKGITKKQLLQLSVRVPSVPEQRRIAEVLSTVDNLIERTEVLIAKQEAIRTGLLQSFTDEHATTGWKPRRLGELANFITSGSRGWASYYSAEGPLFLRIGNLTRRHINFRWEDIQRVTPPVGSEGLRTAVQLGDVLISITADLGIVGVVNESIGPAYINQHIALVRLDTQTVNPRWIGHYLSSERGQEVFRKLNDSGAKAGLNLPAIQSIIVPLPNKKEQDHLAQIIDEADSTISAALRELMKVRVIKSGLMADLLSGRVPVVEGKA